MSQDLPPGVSPGVRIQDSGLRGLAKENPPEAGEHETRAQLGLCDLERGPSLPEPQFPHLYSGGVDVSCLTALLVGYGGHTWRALSSNCYGLSACQRPVSCPDGQPAEKSEAPCPAPSACRLVERKEPRLQPGVCAWTRRDQRGPTVKDDSERTLQGNWKLKHTCCFNKITGLQSHVHIMYIMYPCPLGTWTYVAAFTLLQSLRSVVAKFIDAITAKLPILLLLR